ncbi:MAG: SDR family oxidoreductase [Chitinophagaceae bacterium]|nr:SDR family oxidoreductase [Chitinophagaceae bacterium]
MNIVITGGSKGIGKAIAHRFAAANHNIFLNARTPTTLQKTAEELQKQFPGITVEYYAADISTREGVEAFAGWLSSQNIAIDILVNNAGIFLPGSVHNEPEGTLETMVNTNLYSAYHLTRTLIPGMIERKQGYIFNMCSIASFQAYPNGGAYSISKYALSGFSKNLREEMKPFNIKVTAVYAGAVYTDSWSGSGLPEERFISVKDIAELVYTATLISPSSCVEEIVIRPQLGDV